MPISPVHPSTQLHQLFLAVCSQQWVARLEEQTGRHPRLPCAGEERTEADGETFPVSVPWAQVLWSILNYFWEAGARVYFFLRSGPLGWPPLGHTLPGDKPGLRPRVYPVHQLVVSL